MRVTQGGTVVVIRAIVAGVVIAGASLAAQERRADALSADVQIQQRRFQFQLMEGVLENAVRQGATEVAMRAQGVMPIGMLFMGRPKAKGFPLDGYGVVFDVEIPVIRESAVLLNQMPRPSAANTPPTVGNQTVGGRGSGAGTTRATGVVPDDPMLRSPVTSDPFLANPDLFYRATVREKLVDVMLDYSRSLGVGADEWLSVVSRSEDDPMPNSLYDDSRTLILRIKGADLSLFLEGKISRDEARKRVVESQF